MLMLSGWKGRAQQIKVLKTKLMRYESSCASVVNGSVYGGSSNMVSSVAGGIGMGGVTVRDSSPAKSIRGNSTKLLTNQPSIAGATNIPRHNNLAQGSVIDSKVVNNINDLSYERKAASEHLNQEKDTLFEHNQLLENKLKGYKARVQTLENELNQFKQQIQVLINKSSTDDQFIDALKEEMYRLKGELNSHNLRLNNHNMANLALESGGSDSQELIRLRRLCKHQTEQLNTQDELIHELRGHVNRK